MPQLDLLRALPRQKRDVSGRAAAKTKDTGAAGIARQFGELYFDGPRQYGYGGYRYDGRWLPVARDIVAHYGLKPGDRVLDVGCAKGFLVKDLMLAAPGLDAFGLDISRYAITHCPPEIAGRLHLGSADDLPFPDDSFDFVMSINTVHNFYRSGALTALREIERVARGRAFVQVDAYRSEAERQHFLDWVLTADSHGYPEDWIALFDEAGYRGDYDWTVLDLSEAENA